MVPVWVALDEARDLVLAGRLHNPTAVSASSLRPRPATAAGPACAPPTPPGRSAHPAGSPTPTPSP